MCSSAFQPQSCVLQTNLITFFWKSIKPDYRPETWHVRTLQYWCNTDFIIQVIGTSCLPSINLKWREKKKSISRCRVPVSLNERYVYARAPKNRQKVVFDVWKIFSVVNRQILMFRLHKRLKLRKLFDMDTVIVTSYSFAHGHNVSAQWRFCPCPPNGDATDKTVNIPVVNVTADIVKHP